MFFFTLTANALLATAATTNLSEALQMFFLLRLQAR
jgi:hypothetical protein